MVDERLQGIARGWFVSSREGLKRWSQFWGHADFHPVRHMKAAHRDCEISDLLGCPFDTDSKAARSLIIWCIAGSAKDRVCAYGEGNPGGRDTNDADSGAVIAHGWRGENDFCAAAGGRGHRAVGRTNNPRRLEINDHDNLIARGAIAAWICDSPMDEVGAL